jgi:hydroxyacyl-ACP dehydratase HTD2-like protein with hotdog domain
MIGPALPAAGTEVPIVIRTPNAMDLFMFSASAWLLHRIHYDLPFTTEHDGHPALLIHGPLQGVYMTQTVERWLGRIFRLRSVSYRHLAPAYLGDTLECGGSVTGTDEGSATFDVDLWVRKTDGTVTTTGKAIFAREDGKR